MKNIVTDNLNNIFDVESELVDDEPKQLVRSNLEETSNDLPDDVSKDYNFARDNLYDVIEKGTCLLYTSDAADE